VGIDLDDAKLGGVRDLAGEYLGTGSDLSCRVQLPAEPCPVEHVVAKGERTWLASDKISADQEGLREAAGFGLFGIVERHVPVVTRAEQFAVER